MLSRIARVRKKRLSEWKPLPGPQTEAYYCKADILYFGGSCGGGKTDLLLGLALNQHHHTMLFRREFSQLKGIEQRAQDLYGGYGEYNISNKIWRFYNGKIIEFGAVQLERDKEKYQGRASDGKFFDELCHFTRSQFQFLIGWTRSTIPDQRCRIVCTGNPPTSAEGDWVIDYWAPWLDEKYPHPAKPGELRWFTTLDGKDVEVPNGEPFLHEGAWIKPMSRTFIPASIDDNPYLANTNYKANLQALPKELREKMLEGKFTSTREDHRMQVIPSAWVQMAQERWKQRRKPATPMECMGVDVARSGQDRTVLSPRYGNYFDEQGVYPGTTTPDGPAVTQLIIQKLDRTTYVNVDVIGVGGSVYDFLRGYNIRTYPLNSAGRSDATEKSGQIGFINKRAEWWWKLRESLDPDTGYELALPPSRELLSDLTAPRWELTPSGIKIEKKDLIKERIGRSPDLGDSIVYAHANEVEDSAYGGF